MAKQSTQDRQLRLSEGRCPIHGIWMPQIESWHEEKGISFTIVGCPRKNCNIKVRAYSINGPWDLLPQFKYLLQQGEQGSAVIYEFNKP